MTIHTHTHTHTHTQTHLPDHRAGAIAKESLLLEAFGQCLPSKKVVDRYLSTEEEGTPLRGKSLLPTILKAAVGAKKLAA